VRIFLALVCVVGCGSRAVPMADGGPDGAPAAFELRLAHTDGVPIQDGDSLAVDFGCQGGAHTFFDVVAVGSGLDGAVAELTLHDRTIMRTLVATVDGAAYPFLMFVLRDFATPGELVLPLMTTLRGTVTRTTDGARVTVERSVVLVQGSMCTGGCQYSDTSGIARLTQVEMLSASGCTLEALDVRFDFVAATTLPDQADALLVAPDCVAPMGIVVGAELPVVRRELIPGTGTCSPVAYEFMLDTAACDPICP
jgi:hypothetical protein